MMRFYRALSGAVRVRILTADCPSCLQLLDRAYISASFVRFEDSVTLEMTVSRKDLKKLRAICERKGYELETIRKEGLFWPLHSMLMRPILLVGLLLLTMLACCLPDRIIFISTEGNDEVPSRYILDAAEQCGLKFLTNRRDIRSEQIKNYLLEHIPQLQWVGVNTYGCRAVITVRERAAYEDEASDTAVSHIAAARDGVIRSCTVTRGSRNCTIGQAVRRGDILISGYTDCGLTYTAERAGGEILAQTQRSMCVVTPKSCLNQLSGNAVSHKFSILLGKKRINFYKGSGISGATCDKMYSKYVLTLPGGFSLPVALLKETTVSCLLTEAAIQNPEQMLADFAANYLTDQMTDGVIERKAESLTELDGVFRLTGVYGCLESIGIEQDEKIGEINGQTDGADRECRPGG